MIPYKFAVFPLIRGLHLTGEELAFLPFLQPAGNLHLVPVQVKPVSRIVRVIRLFLAVVPEDGEIARFLFVCHIVLSVRCQPICQYNESDNERQKIKCNKKSGFFIVNIQA